MSRDPERTGHLRPLRWMFPLAAALLALAAWSGGPEAGARENVAEARGSKVTASDGPLAPELIRDAQEQQTARPSGAWPAADRDVQAAQALAETPEEEPADASPVVPVPPMARYEGLTLYVPSVDPVLVGFHEAGTRDGLGLDPIGPLIENNNTTRFEAPEDDPDGTPYRILHSRGRAAAPTSAVDVAMRDDDPVLSPVAGIVTDVRRFYLGGRHLDRRVEIQPDDAPHLRVIVIHVEGLTVDVGDRVEAGTTVLAASARRFPFTSQIDYVIDDGRWPHVHLEVKREGAARPGDG